MECSLDALISTFNQVDPEAMAQAPLSSRPWPYSPCFLFPALALLPSSLASRSFGNWLNVCVASETSALAPFCLLASASLPCRALSLYCAMLKLIGRRGPVRSWMHNSPP